MSPHWLCDVTLLTVRAVSLTHILCNCARLRYVDAIRDAEPRRAVPWDRRTRFHVKNRCLHAPLTNVISIR
ncbi:unnamed protein product, partial [Iphiclides podalirius]